MGYGDHPFAAYLEPPLSSVRLPSEEVGPTAVDLLLRQLSRQTSAAGPQKVCLDAGVVVRSSTARCLS
jgi:LacI family transcriptional regulator